jgi:hypothetical protein
MIGNVVKLPLTCLPSNNLVMQWVYTEPVLYSHTIHEDSLECSAWMDWICQSKFPNELVESVEFPYARTRLKITSCLLWFSLLYLCWCRQPSYHSWWKI